MAAHHAHHSGASAGVWPGYVAAVAGLVQSLLFLSAVVATVVYLMGSLGNQGATLHAEVGLGDGTGNPGQVTKANRAKDKDKDKVNTKAGSPPVDDGPKPLPPPQGDGLLEPPVGFRKPDYRLPNGLQPLSIMFPTTQVELDKPTSGRLEQLVNDFIKQGANHWRLVAHFDSNDSLSMRRAYYRMQMLRNLLIERGVETWRIETRMLPVDGEVHPENQIVILAAKYNEGQTRIKP
jgi:hypothetical protein